MRVPPEAAWRLITNLVRCLAQLNTDDPQAQEVLAKVHQDIADATGLDYDLRALLQDKALAVLSQATVKEGTPIAGVGQLIRSPTSGANDNRIYEVHLFGTSLHVILTEPVFADPAPTDRGDEVVVAGVYTGRSTRPDGTGTVTLKAGFLILAPNNKYWKGAKPARSSN
jgi:hypothetical protein